MSIAVIILTFNEEDHVGPAIESVRGWADEIFVVDSYSTDNTVDAALGYCDEGVRVVQHVFENYSSQWNWSLSNLPITADWTLKLDADERTPEDFKQEVLDIISNSGPELEGLYFRRRIIFMNKALRFGGNASYDLRMWRTGSAKFDGREINEHAVVEGSTAILKSYVDHHDTKTITEWWDKHNRYSSLEALSMIDTDSSEAVRPRLFGDPVQRMQWLKRAYWSQPFRFLSSVGLFSYHFFFKLGILDGTRGFQIAALRAIFFYMTDLKLIEYRRTGKRPVVDWPARGEPHPTLPRSLGPPRQDSGGNPL
ncbi:glycosyltransferase family 2 protein [Myxococcota bacterium]|nr:glycosyltransferase family 2 protein [Myxococcota bacterium]